MKKGMMICLVLCLLLAGCTPYSELVPQTPQDVLDVAMYVVTGGSSPEPLILGSDGTPAVMRSPTGIAALICAKVTHEVVSLTENGDTAVAVLNITAPDAVSLMYQALEGMETFDEEAFTAKMEELLGAEPAMQTHSVTLDMTRVDGVWCMEVNADFSNAITGGLMERYNEIQQAILDAYMEGGEG